MKKTTHNSIKLWAVVVWLLVWQGGSMFLQSRLVHASLLLPSPLEALESLFQMARTADFWRTISWSTVRIFGGFLAATAAASLLAVPAYRFRPVRELLAPLVACVKTIPVASFIILALVWLKRIPNKKQSVAPIIPVTNCDSPSNCLDITKRRCYDTENKKKGVNFMLNMVNFIVSYGRSLAPWVFVG